MKVLIAAILLLAVIETARGEANLAILTCPDRYGPMVFSLNLDTHSVVSAVDKNFGKSQFMFGGVPISATETELVWIWKNGYTDLGSGPIKGVIRKYTLDRYTLEMTTDFLINSEHSQYHHKCYLSRRAL